MGTDQAESHTTRQFRRSFVCIAPVYVQAVLLSTSSIGIVSSVVAISVTSKRRWRPRSSVPALAPANSRNQTATRAGRQTDCQDAQQPDRTASCARRGRRAAASIVQGLPGGERAREGEKQIGRCGAEKHRIAPPRTSIRIYSSRCVPSVRQLPAAASSCP